MPRSQPRVAVTHGSTWSKNFHTSLFLITEARFPADAVLEPHTHPRAIGAVMMAGSFDTKVGGRVLDCSPGAFWTEPREERHANRAGRGGAHVLVVQPDPERSEELRPLLPLLEGVSCIARSGLTARARAVSLELRRPDALTPLSIDGLVLQMLGSVARLRARSNDSAPPPWLSRARDILHEEFRAAPGLGDIARQVGVPLGTLAVAFRRHYGRNPGAYARDVRFEWALDQLTRTDRSIAGIAIEAGYADQSHFTRDCAARLGTPPARLRAMD